MVYNVSRNPEGRPAGYGEPKGRVTMSITQAGVDGLDHLAGLFNLSRSELVERIGRGLIPLAVPPQALALGCESSKVDSVKQ